MLEKAKKGRGGIFGKELEYTKAKGGRRRRRRERGGERKEGDSSNPKFLDLGKK